METTRDDTGITCRLLREDGTEWRVTKIEFRGDRTTVSGFPLGGSGEEHEASAPASEWITDEPLARGDRLVWLDASGTIVWAMRIPLGRAEALLPVGAGPVGGNSSGGTEGRRSAAGSES